MLVAILLVACSTANGPGSGTSPAASFPSGQSFPRLSSFSTAYDRATRQLLLFGLTEADLKPMTWSWDGKAWNRLRPDQSAPGRGGSLAYDSATESLVLYGLTADGSSRTWEWKAGIWAERQPTTMPPSSYSFTLGDNEAGRNIIAFGGCCAQSLAPSQTWAWNGDDWKRLQPKTMPSDRYGVSLLYDRAIQKLVLFGGYERGSGNQSNDLWTWDGSAWVREYPTGVLPLELANAAIGYDAVHRTIVLLARSGKFDVGTWTWDGKEWTLRPSRTPPATVAYQMAWDDATQQLVLFDEVSVVAPQTWIWNGTDWERKG